MQASKGFRQKTRRKFKNRLRQKPVIAQFLQSFENGSKVVIRQCPMSHRGMAHPSFLGKVGVVEGKRGQSFLVNVAMGNSEKRVFVRPEHLKRL